jgi:hypothetical protein
MDQAMASSSSMISHKVGHPDPLTLKAEFSKLVTHEYQLPRRLTARQQTLDLFIEVRILAGQLA